MSDGRTIGGPDTPEEWLEHAGWVRALARALVRDAATADDVVQETWLAALRRAPRTSGPLRPWLARIVRNVATDRARAETRRIDRESAQASRDPEHARAPDEIAESIETQKLLLASVEKLADPLRSAVVRRYFHGMTSIEIAREDGVGESTVRERIERGLQALRRDLDARHRGDRGAWMAALVPIARRADVHAASVAGSTAIVTTGLAMATMWKIAVAALVVVAAFVGVHTWTQAPVATKLLATQTLPKSLDTNAADGVNPQKASSAREAVSVSEAPTASATTSPTEPDRIARVEARIVDKSGAPIDGTQLAWIDAVEQHKIERKDAPSANSTPDGHVLLELHQPDWSLRGSMSDWADTVWQVNLEVTAPRFAPHRVSIQLDEGHTTSCGTIVLNEGGTIAGRIVDEHDDAVADANVHIVLPDMTLTERDELPWKGLTARSIAYTQTAADGTYHFEGIAVGRYCIWTRKAGLECSFDDDVRVEAGETARPDPIVMREDASAIRGMIVGVDGKGASTRMLYAPIGQPPVGRWKETKSQADGQFVIDVPPGTTVDVDCNDEDGKPPSAAFQRGLEAGSRGVVIALKPLPIIELVVQDERGESVPQWNVNISDVAGAGATYMNQRHQHWKTPGRAGPFVLRFDAQGFRSKSLGPYDPKSVPTILVVTLERERVITGHITGGGRAIGYARIYRASTLPAGLKTANGFPLRLEWIVCESPDVSQDGTYTMTIPDGAPSTVVVQPWGPDGEDAPDGFARAEVGPVDFDALSSRTLELELQRGGRLEGHVLGFSPSTSTMTFVSASHGETIVRSKRIQADGSYAFEHMAAGTWFVRPTDCDYTDRYRIATAPPEPANVPVVISEGKTSQLDLSMPSSKGVTVDGVLTWPHMSPGMWTATLIPPDMWNGSEDEQSVAADGTFHLHTEDGGRHHLRLRMVSSEQGSCAIDCDLDLVPGVNAWNFAPELGAVSVTSSPVRDLALECRSPEGIVWSAQWRTSGSGQEVLESVPAGEVKISGGGRLLSTVRVQPHAVATVVWN